MQMHASPVQLAIRLKAPNDFRPELPPSVPSSSSRQRSDKNANDSQLITQNHPGPVLGNHQFWLNDIKIAESLYTIHRSGTHLVEYTSGLLGSGRNDQLELAANPDNDKPVPIMSDGDVFFMTQLANDIARSVGEISAVRHHGIRAEERKRRHSQRDPARPHQSRRSGSYTKRQRKLSDTRACQKCGRNSTPEWRRGPDGSSLCNVCGLLYEKRKHRPKGQSSTNNNPTG